MQTLTGPTTSPWLQKIQWALNPVHYMDEAAQTYGDIFYSGVIGNQPVLLVSHPQALQQIFSNDTKQFTAPANKLIQPIVGNQSIFAMEGERHMRERKLLMPPFHGERMRAYGQLICDLTLKMIDPIQPGDRFIARTVLQDVSMEVILRAVFGLSDGERYCQLKQLIADLTNAFQVPYIGGLLYFPALQRDWTPWRVVRRLKQTIDRLLVAEIHERRQINYEDRSDILSLLLSTRSETGESLSDVELCDELFTLLLAGHETTSNAITWALYWIHSHLDVRDKLQQELTQLGAIDPLSLVRLPYLTAVCNEALRLYPVAMLTVPRATKAPVELMGHAIPAGTRLYGCIYLTHQRQDLYPNPKQFRPERFLERQFSPYEFLPFGGGVRRCIGEALALFEMKLVVATILSRYTLSLADTTPEAPKRRGVNLTPGKGVRMILQGRRGYSQ